MAVHDRFGPSNHSAQSGAGATAPAAPTVPAHEAIATAPTTAPARPRPAAHQAAQWAATLLANLNATRP